MALEIQLARRSVAADVHGLRAAGMEAAARRRIDGAGHIAFEDDALLSPAGIDGGHRGKQRLGIGMKWVAVECFAGAAFHDLAQIHHGHAVRDVFDHREIVRDEQIGEVELFAQLDQQVDDLRLNGDIQGRDGLVEHHEARVEGQSAGHTDALPLASGEFMGIAVQIARVEAHLFERLDHFFQPLLPVAQPMDHQPFLDDAADGHTGIERAERVLKDDLHVASQAAQDRASGGAHVQPIEQHAPGRGQQQSQDGPAGSGLAAARLAHQAERFAPADLKADVVHRAHMPHHTRKQPPAHGKVLLEVFDLQQRTTHRQQLTRAWVPKTGTRRY